MIVVIIAGGSGTRLWPLSTPDYPKHLLNLTGSKSLLQYTFDRAKAVGKSVYVLTDASHAHHVKEQLPELSDDSFIVEPARRGTAGCIVAALEKIGRDHDHSEPIAFLAADHYIRDTRGFTQSFKVAGSVSKKTGRIVLVGADPDHPATGFGYIEMGKACDEEPFVFNVQAFREKPDFKTAQTYVSSGDYLWNCGYFVGSTDTFLEEMRKHAPELYENCRNLQGADAKSYENVYLQFSEDSIDYALIEKLTNLLVVPAAFDWMDLGSYGDLHKAVESDEAGNHCKGEDILLEGVENSFVQNFEDKPIAVIGLDNVVIVNTKHGLLVTRKDLSQKVGEVSKRFKKK